MMQPANDERIAVSQETYDTIIIKQHLPLLNTLGVDTREFRGSVNVMIRLGADRDTAFKQVLDEYVVVEPQPNDNHDGIETDAQFIADWQAWVDEQDKSRRDDFATFHRKPGLGWYEALVAYYGHGGAVRIMMQSKDEPDDR